MRLAPHVLRQVHDADRAVRAAHRKLARAVVEVRGENLSKSKAVRTIFLSIGRGNRPWECQNRVLLTMPDLSKLDVHAISVNLKRFSPVQKCPKRKYSWIPEQ